MVQYNSPGSVVNWKMAILCFFIFLGIALAQDKSHDLGTIVVSATKTEKQAEKLVSSVTVIDRKDIEASPARTVADLLLVEAGVESSEPQGVGVVTPQTQKIRGNGFAGHVQVLVDGQQINTPFTGYAYLTTIPVRAVEKIEIVKGAGSALYGSSSGGGVINIITRDGSLGSSAGGFFNIGNYGRLNGGGDIEIARKKFSFGLFYDFRNEVNYLRHDSSSISHGKNIVIPDTSNKDYQHNRLHGHFTLIPSEVSEFSLSGGFILGKTGNGYSTNLKVENRQENFQPYINLQGRTSLNDRLDIQGQADWLFSRHDYRGETLTEFDEFMGVTEPVFEPSLNTTDAHRFRADVRTDISISENHILTTGLEGILSTGAKEIIHNETKELLDVQGRSGMALDTAQSQGSGYLQYDGEFLKRFGVVLGARYDYYTGFGGEFSPKAGFRINAWKGAVFRGNIGRGYRLPTLSERFSTPWSITTGMVYQGNPDLKPEEMWSWDFSYEQSFLERSIMLAVSPYFTRAKNFITSERFLDPFNPAGMLMTPMNVDSVNINGVETKLLGTIVDRITPYISYTWNKTTDAGSDKILDYYPKHTVSLGVRGSTSVAREFRIFGSWNSRYMSSFTASSWGNPPVVFNLGKYWITDIRLGCTWKEIVTLSGNVCNLFDKRVITSHNKVNAARNFLIELSAKMPLGGKGGLL